MRWSGWASDVRSNELYEEVGDIEELRQGMLKSESYTGAHSGGKVVNCWRGQRPSGNFGGKSLSKN